MSGLFSGIMIEPVEQGFNLNMGDVKLEFNESFEVVNAMEKDFDQYCDAMARITLLNQSISANNGKADKQLFMFLNQNNELASALGIDLSLEAWDDVVNGAEISAACEGIVGDAWQAIKNFFKNIWDGLKSFFSNFGKMFSSTEQKLKEAGSTNVTAEKAKQGADSETPEQSKAAAESSAVKALAQKAGVAQANGGIASTIYKDDLLNVANHIMGFGDKIVTLYSGKDFKSLYDAAAGGKIVAEFKSLAQSRISSQCIKVVKGGSKIEQFSFSGTVFDAEYFKTAKNVGHALLEAGYFTPDVKQVSDQIIAVLEQFKQKAEALTKLLDPIKSMAEMNQSQLSGKEQGEDPGTFDLETARSIGKGAIVACQIFTSCEAGFDAVATDILAHCKRYSERIGKENARKAGEQLKKDIAEHVENNSNGGLGTGE